MNDDLLPQADGRKDAVAAAARAAECEEVEEEQIGERLDLRR